MPYLGVAEFKEDVGENQHRYADANCHAQATLKLKKKKKTLHLFVMERSLRRTDLTSRIWQRRDWEICAAIYTSRSRVITRTRSV